MSTVATNANKDRAKIFGTVLSSPGMNEKCKINLTVSRQNIVLLSRLIEGAFLSEKNNSEDEIISAVPKESLEEFKEIHEEILKKGQLTEFYEIKIIVDFKAFFCLRIFVVLINYCRSMIGFFL